MDKECYYFLSQTSRWDCSQKIVIYVINTTNCWCITVWSICQRCNL